MIDYIQHNILDENEIIKKINDFLDEDMPNGDITTDLTVDENTIIEADIITMEPMIFSGKKIIPYCFDSDIKIHKNDNRKYFIYFPHY